jgi:UDPglucose--hexose-1-phosphate uridylyltransferase
VDFGQIREDQVDDLARILRTTLKKLSVALNRPPYNLVISTAPVNTGSSELIHFHWHLEILPRLTIAAGFELGTGYFINPTPPEIAASDLRDTDIVYDGQYVQKYEEVGSYV